MTCRLLFAACLLALNGCASVVSTLAPGAAREACFEAVAGTTLWYRFEAAAPVRFNLHYHVDDEVYYPVPEHVTAAEKGRFVVPVTRDYCLMWINDGDRPVTVDIGIDGAEPVYH